MFAAGFRNVFGVAINEPYDTYIPYDVYIAPGLVGMVLLFNGMQSSLAMVYDREMGLMRLLLTAPLPRWWILLAKLSATAVLSLVQAVAFLIVAALLGTALPVWGPQTPAFLAAIVAAALMLGALGLLLSVHIKQLENFAGTMNFVIFPMYFMSTAPVPAVEAGGVRRRVGLVDRPLQPLHPCGRVDALRALRQGSGPGPLGGAGHAGGLFRTGGLGL